MCKLVFQVLGIGVVLLFPFLCRLLDALDIHILVGLDFLIGIIKLFLHPGELGNLGVKLLFRHIASVLQVYDFQFAIRLNPLDKLLRCDRLRLAVYFLEKFLQKFVHGVPPLSSLILFRFRFTPALLSWDISAHKRKSSSLYAIPPGQ